MGSLPSRTPRTAETSVQESIIDRAKYEIDEDKNVSEAPPDNTVSSVPKEKPKGKTDDSKQDFMDLALKIHNEYRSVF